VLQLVAADQATVLKSATTRSRSVRSVSPPRKCCQVTPVPAFSDIE
jgi:hypothetical protein